MVKPGNAAAYPTSTDVAVLLDWHLNFGTRPGGRPGVPGRRWTNQEFADRVCGGKERNVRNWRNGTNRPQDLASIERELFGEDKAAVYAEWRADLRAAFDTKPLPARAEFPSTPTHFLGRDADIAIITQTILSNPTQGVAILVQGTLGIGKTALTQAVANRPDIIARFGAENRWFVRLETATTAAAMQSAILTALGADPAQPFPIALKNLANLQGLLVLDNLETPWDSRAARDATEATIAALAAIPALAILASFRGTASVAGPAWALVHPVQDLKPPHDTNLFRRVSNRPTGDDALIANFIAALGGLPLAIELVAKRAHSGTNLAKLWAEWEKIGADLAIRPGENPARLTSLSKSIELSLASSRMTRTANRLFRLLGQLPAGLAAEDRDALLGEHSYDAEEALLGIGLALDRGDRLDLLPPIREHAASRQRPEPADAEAWPIHYLTLVHTRGEAIGTREGDGAIRRLLPEFPNIEVAIQTLLTTRRRADVMPVLRSLNLLTYLAAIPTPIFNTLAEACRSDHDVLGQAGCIKSLGDIALARSDHTAAKHAYEQAIPLFKQVGSLQGEAGCVRSLGEIALARYDHTAAKLAFEQAMPLFRQIGNLQGEAFCIRSLGDIAFSSSDLTAAKLAYEQAMTIFEQVGNLQGEAICIRCVGDIALDRSDLTAAKLAYERAMTLHKQVGDPQGEAICIQSLGDIALHRSDHTAATQAYEQATPLFKQTGDLQGEAICIKSVGDIALDRSDLTAAMLAYEQAMPLFKQVGDLQGEANCIRRLGDIALHRADHTAAKLAYEQAMRLYNQVGDLLGKANCVVGFGDVAHAQSGHTTARAHYEQALSLYRQFGNPAAEAVCLRRLQSLPPPPESHQK